MSDAPLDEVRRFWDDDAATYDRSEHHAPTTAPEKAAWLETVGRFLPPSPAKVLDVGAGTGFLALQAARLGHQVTALDLSSEMLGLLREKATAEGLDVSTVEGPAHEPPPGPFDAVIERHLAWTLPDPAGTLAAWRSVCPDGRLVLFESRWGAGATPWQARRFNVGHRLEQMLGRPPDHHGDYRPELRASLPLGRGTRPEDLVTLVESAGWGRARVEDLTGVQRASKAARPLPWRWFGAPSPFAVTVP